MKIVKDLWDTLKKPIIILGIFVLIILIVSKVVPAVKNKAAEKSPIIKITAENDNMYAQGEKISPSDFNVIAVHENGAETRISSKQVKLSKTTPDPTGKTTPVKISAAGKNCTIEVKNDRTKLVTFECGNPDVSAVKAVLYSNGELAFEGEGDILAFSNDDFPWKSYDGDDDYPVRSVTFEDTVTPVSMDGFFTDMEYLAYVETVPKTVESMVNTFSGCISLVETPDITGCNKLLDITEAFSDCTALEKASAIPENVKNMTGAFSGCTALKNGADVSKAANVNNADSLYADCLVLNNAQLPPAVQSIDNAFENCINMKTMPEIPGTVQYMSSCFSGDISLTTLGTIPEGVKDIGNAFDGCTKIRGSLIINCNPESYNGFLNDTAVATTLDLQGASKVLDVLAATSDQNMNITVNGKTPNWEADYNELMEPEESITEDTAEEADKEDETEQQE